MEVPSPVPLRQPWSPAGYQVVEVANETPPPVLARATDAPAPLRPRAPSSPVGYRVTVTETPAPAPAVVPFRRLPRQRLHPLLVWAPLTAGACLVFVVMCALITAMVAQSGPQPPAVALIESQVEVPPVVRLQPGDIDPVVIDREQRPAAKKPPLAGGKEDCAVCRAEASETFGTRVSFARNPTEALQAAADERKLAFVLHVSGNFEEARFT